MTMECVKTGCHMYSREYQESWLGDLYQLGPVGPLVLKCRANGRSHSPIRSVLNMIATEIDFWQMGDWYVVFIHDHSWYSYEGEPLTRTEG